MRFATGGKREAVQSIEKHPLKAAFEGRVNEVVQQKGADFGVAQVQHCARPGRVLADQPAVLQACEQAVAAGHLSDTDVGNGRCAGFGQQVDTCVAGLILLLYHPVVGHQAAYWGFVTVIERDVRRMTHSIGKTEG